MKSKWWLAALGISLLAAILSPLASASPDGLEKVAETQGFLDSARSSPFQMIADYVFPGIQNEVFATMLAGVIGTLILFGVVFGLSRLLITHRSKDK